ncbi:HlyD family type I secretion periplasmic adaptor subunit [Shimia haliotis]|uniref:Membrane fusion protein (MFP) family protein n=1 Tax=Shimia haliotis TaxID=1280847 RepID=A0A1I4FJ71_9RHOB|nr:HlyD family type I secretion periplasmic adaptor subunit [Shimia haliotis]SFL17995.1 HlyD family secretion protein [Shimia haliotis]
MSQRHEFSVRGPLVFGVLALTVLLGGFGVWSVATEISGAIIASGRVEVDRNRQVVQHIDGGIVTEINVDEGDLVEADQLLIRLDDTLLRSDLSVVEGQLWEMMARRGRLEAERDGSDAISFEADLLEAEQASSDVAGVVNGQRNLFEARRDTLRQATEQLDKQVVQIRNQMDGLGAQTEALSVQLGLIQKELADQQQLFDKGLAQAARVLALQREEAGLAGQVGELTATRAQAEVRITEIDIEKLKLETARREEAISTLRDLRYRELELIEKRRNILARLNRLDIRSPVAGVVYGLQVFALQSVIRPADPVLFVVPQDRPLVVAAQVPTIHVDQVFPGQDVTLRFSAFDQRTTPELLGRVTQISADAFQDDATGVSFYRAEIELAEGEEEKLPTEVALIPGMPVDAYLKTQDRTPLAYLIKPLSDYFVKAFRES